MTGLLRQKKSVLIIFYICCISFLLFTCTKSERFILINSGEQRPFIDLGEWSFDSDGPVRLFHNVWELYWNRLYTPASFSTGDGRVSYSDKPVLVKGGEAWNGTIVNGEVLPANGYATYRTILRIPQAGKVYSFYMTNQDSAYRFWINGELLGGNGRVAAEAADYKPQRLPKIYHHYASTRDLELVLQIANYDHKWGGLTNNIFVGTPAQIFGYISRLHTNAAFLGGAVLIMAIYHLFIFLNRKKDIAPLFFSLFCFTVIFWYLFTEDYIFFQIFPNFPLFAGTRLYFISLFILAPLFLLFINSVYRGKVGKRLLVSSLTVSLIIAAAPVFMPVSIFTNYVLYIFYITVFINCIIIFIILIRAAAGKAEGVWFSIAGFIVVAGVSIYDILANAKIIVGNPYGPFMPYSLFIFILLQSFLLARRFSGAYNRLDELLENLEKLLAERTSQLADAQKEIAEREKLAAIGTMVGGINHEIMNPLSGITGPLSILRKEVENSELSGNEKVRKHLDYMEENANEITTVVRNLNILIKDNKILKKQFNPAGISARLIAKVRNQYPNLDIEYIDECKKDLYADEEILFSILNNVVSNSIDSTGPEGVVRIIYKEDCIIIVDNGMGMTNEEAVRACDAFYTTKREHGGTGLGLYLVKRYAASLGWKVEIESKPEQGTKIRLMFG